MSLSSSKGSRINNLAEKWKDTFKRYQATGNKTPAQADVDLANMCKDLATEMFEEVYWWISESKIPVNVISTGVPGNTAIHPVASNDFLNKQYTLDI